MKRLKTGTLPARADPDVQEAFKKELEPRLAQAQAGQRAVFFVDAAHFVLGAFMSVVWCFARVWIRAPSGRQRFNVLGALDAVTEEVVTIVNSNYINSLSVCALLEKLATLRSLPITVVLDNARYQRCALVQACTDALKIELLFLPAYSPNLNLIERLWKFVKNSASVPSTTPTSVLSPRPSTVACRMPHYPRQGAQFTIEPELPNLPEGSVVTAQGIDAC